MRENELTRTHEIKEAGVMIDCASDSLNTTEHLIDEKT